MSRVLRFDQLSTRELDAWHLLRAANPLLDSPNVHPASRCSASSTAAVSLSIFGSMPFTPNHAAD